MASSMAMAIAARVPGTTTIGADHYQTISYEKNPAASDITFQLQSSTDLKTWQNETAIEVEPNTYRTATPASGTRQHLRLLISVQP